MTNGRVPLRLALPSASIRRSILSDRIDHAGACACAAAMAGIFLLLFFQPMHRSAILNQFDLDQRSKEPFKP
jgi:hypothetical protein